MQYEVMLYDSISNIPKQDSIEYDIVSAIMFCGTLKTDRQSFC